MTDAAAAPGAGSLLVARIVRRPPRLPERQARDRYRGLPARPAAQVVPPRSAAGSPERCHGAAGRRCPVPGPPRMRWPPGPGTGQHAAGIAGLGQRLRDALRHAGPGPAGVTGQRCHSAIFKPGPGRVRPVRPGLRDEPSGRRFTGTSSRGSRCPRRGEDHGAARPARGAPGRLPHVWPHPARTA